ncbi:MAG: hypothetical protein CML22_07480 [Rheinheimera sp.]|nr:hypothetical protein [Rheinheimera sp.]MBM34125.1 hypothetical protein [Rheinheimera sp.]|tara:strand:- start:32 stop:370 length:339 start_codon:yes stop_codon:yes gene_type:complete
MPNKHLYIIDQAKRLAYRANLWIADHKAGLTSAPMIEPIPGEGIEYELTKCHTCMVAGHAKIEFCYTAESEDFTFTFDATDTDVNSIQQVTPDLIRFIAHGELAMIRPGDEL